MLKFDEKVAWGTYHLNRESVNSGMVANSRVLYVLNTTKNTLDIMEIAFKLYVCGKLVGHIIDYRTLKMYMSNIGILIIKKKNHPNIDHH